MFLTTDACPTGYNTVEDGYIKLGSSAVTTDASPRTLSSPGHGHSHSLYNSSYGGHGGLTATPVMYALAAGNIYPYRFYQTQGSHSHTITGTVGSSGVAGDTPQAITGDLEHITLRLCVRSS